MKTKEKRILVVEDDPSIQRALKRSLMVNGYDVTVVDAGRQAVELARAYQPDLILLDLCLPGEVDGLDVCVQIRQWSQTPIIVVSARSEEQLKVQALDLGADDYLTKPFNNQELLARVRVCLRRAAAQDVENAPHPDIISTIDGYLLMNLVRHQVFAGEQKINLTPTEYELLHQLMLNACKVMTHRVLLREVWGPEYGDEADYLRVYVRQLRRKVELDSSQPRYIITEPGVGYVFNVQVIFKQESGVALNNVPPGF
ncbi:MAG TPA: response regulator transcription factor [Ktedonobacteraceae bacterium]|nr:response regulator transcription factor [Ktedonobacteraceae bacterium]